MKRHALRCIISTIRCMLPSGEVDATCVALILEKPPALAGGFFFEASTSREHPFL